MARLLAFLFLVAALASPALAGEAEDALRRGVAAYKAGDQPTALAAFRTAAELGAPIAQFNLGLMYASGQGAPKDEAAAAHWWRKAAENGVADAQNNLGLLYENGRGVAQDYAQAARWYRAAALQEKPQAQHNLGALYANGRGVERDLVRAHMWFALAVARHEPGPGLEESSKARDLVATQLSQAGRKKAERLARDWSPAREIEAAKAAAAPEPARNRTAAREPAKARIAAAQRALRKLGYDPGPADGLDGPRTRAALGAFQRSVALPETGRLSDEVFERLLALAPDEKSAGRTR